MAGRPRGAIPRRSPRGRRGDRSPHVRVGGGPSRKMGGLSPASKIDDDVAEPIEAGAGPGRNEAGRIILLDDQRAGKGRPQIGPAQDGNLPPPVLPSEIRLAQGPAGRPAGRLGGTYGQAAQAPPRHLDRHELHRFVRSRPVPVGVLVLGREGLRKLAQPCPADPAGRCGNLQLENLTVIMQLCGTQALPGFRGKPVRGKLGVRPHFELLPRRPQRFWSAAPCGSTPTRRAVRSGKGSPDRWGCRWRKPRTAPIGSPRPT